MSKKMSTVIRTSFKEYVETWSNLIYAFYQEGMSEDVLFRELQLSEEAQVHFSLELSTVLSVIAVLSFEAKPKLCTSEKYRGVLITQIVEDVYRRVLTDADQETLGACVKYFNGKHSIFSQICKNIYSTNPKKRQNELIGFARYLAAQVSVKEEATIGIALEKLGILLSSASDAYMTLLENTTQDTIQLDGKPSFSVKKEK
jgi:hypothetical protein